MPEPERSISFRLPDAETLEGYLVELPGGRRVIRTRAELVELPAELRVELPPPEGVLPEE